MIHILHDFDLTDRRLATMAEDRKRLFVDMMGWEVPVIAGRYEIDGFDGGDATYLVATANGHDHEGSMRLLPTSTPHILGDIFPHLCSRAVPRGQRIAEITRLCLPSRLGAQRRLEIRNRLISAMVDHALIVGLEGLTGVVTEAFLVQILAMGWTCRRLGEEAGPHGARLGAFQIEIDADTPAKLDVTGIYRPNSLHGQPARKAA